MGFIHIYMACPSPYACHCYIYVFIFILFIFFFMFYYTLFIHNCPCDFFLFPKLKKKKKKKKKKSFARGRYWSKQALGSAVPYQYTNNNKRILNILVAGLPDSVIGEAKSLLSLILKIATMFYFF